MKTLVLAVLAGFPLAQQAPPPGMHRSPAPETQPMRQFTWRDAGAGYTFIGPPRWAGVVQAMPLASGHGVRFVAGGRTVLTLHSAGDAQAQVHEGSGERELSRREGRVITAQLGTDAGPLALSEEEMGSAIRWNGGTAGEALR